MTRSKKIDLRKKQSQRSVYICHVIGSKGSGKSTICKRHVKNAKIEVNRKIMFDLDTYDFFENILESLGRC